MALDRDGSQAYLIDTFNRVIQLTLEQMRFLGDESATGVVAPGSYVFHLAVFFPELRNIAGYWIGTEQSLYNTTVSPLTLVEVSADSTNGVDGAWSIIPAALSVGVPVRPAYRTSIVAVSVASVRAIRFAFATDQYSFGNFLSLHLYGAPSAGQALNRLAIWHPTLNRQIGGADLDWGDTPELSSATRTFRVKNLSDTLLAVAPLLGFDALTDAIPSVLGQHTLTLDGSNFSGQVTLPDLAPGAISDVVTVRRVTPVDAALSLWAIRLVASATRWDGS